MAEADIVSHLEWLKTEFIQEVRVVDLDKGYLSVSSFNLRMKSAVLHRAGQAIAEVFASDQPKIVHGIPHSGHYLATAVTLALGQLGKETRLHSSRKDQFIPSSWKDVYRREIRSYTASLGGIDVFSGINLSFVKAGDKVLVVDDVCAHGDTGFRIVSGLLEKSVKVVGFAVMFDKVWQGGLERVAGLGVKVFSSVRVSSLTDHDGVILASDHGDIYDHR